MVLARAIWAGEMSFARTRAPAERRRVVMGMPGPQPSSRMEGCCFWASSGAGVGGGDDDDDDEGAEFEAFEVFERFFL